MSEKFRVGVTRDFLKPDGSIGFGDIGLKILDDAPGVEWEFLAQDVRELSADQVKDFDALLVLGPRVTPATLAGTDRLAIVARFGVGYDNVDLDACTESGVLVTITPDGVRRPMAASIMAFILALSMKMVIKDRMTRDGRWGERMDHMGVGLTGRVLGLVGMGNIGREVLKLAAPFGMRHLVYDPYVSPTEIPDAGAEPVDLETLLRTSDFVVVSCPLTPQTHHLIDARRLALMKRTAYLVNAARGPIVDQKALTDALSEKRIQGAGLDVYEQEPVHPADPILTLDNVIIAPHSLCWTDECFLGNGTSAINSILDVAAGRMPRYVVNRAVMESETLQKKLDRYSMIAGSSSSCFRSAR